MVFNCMSDGRCLTDWRPICQTNAEEKMRHGISNNQDYRMYLQQNASQIMHQNMNNNFCVTTDSQLQNQNDSGHCQYCCACLRRNPYKSFAPRPNYGNEHGG